MFYLVLMDCLGWCWEILYVCKMVIRYVVEMNCYENREMWN